MEKVKLYGKCKLFIWNNGKVEEIPTEKVFVKFEFGKPMYFLKENPDEKRYIVQAISPKKAVAKFLTMLKNDRRNQ